MKELSIEEKAKAYDEAYKVAAELHNLCKEGTQTAFHRANLEMMFPELKESEDERIRKDIIWVIASTWLTNGSNINGIKTTKQEALAWLEKQGDKDKLIQELGEYKVKYTQEVLKSHLNKMNNKDNERLRKTTIAFLKDFAEQGYENAVECIDWLEKQGKDNKKEYSVWVGGSEINDHYLTKDEAEKLADKYRKNGYDDVVVKEIKHNLDWSEEDEKLLNEVIELIDAGALDREEKDNYINRLKSLKDRVQPQQEWSEEDEKMIQDIINDIAIAQEQAFCKYRCEEEINWIKSLKPQNKWKPSKKQMEALLSEVNGWTKGCPKQKVLESLYNDLKKL